MANTLIEQTVIVNNGKYSNRTNNTSVRIIEDSDNRDSDNWGSTISVHTHVHMYS